MSDHSTHIGKEGEQLASTYLQELGFEIVAQNYRYGRLEIDLIARKADVLHFIEVKTRTQSSFGLPEEAVDTKKIQRMLAVAEHFQHSQDEATISWRHIQFDIISIQLHSTGERTISYIEDIYV